MKRFFLAFVLVCLAVSVSGQDITGKWNGVMDVMGRKLRIVFNVTQTDSGFVSTMDSPDQGANGIPVTKTTFQKPEIKFELPALGIVYEGKLENDTMFAGDFKQSGFTFPLKLTRSEPVVEKPSRPQEPEPPYPYYSEDVKFENKTDGITLAGTLTIPDKSGRYPAVVLISGSGSQNRDEEIMGHKPFLVLADYLTRHGIAVLRFDDRGAGESGGDAKNATTADLANDVVAAVNYLTTRKEIDKKHIGLIGHSEGGMIAPMVANRTKNVNFIVLMAAPGVNGATLLLQQQAAISHAMGMGDDYIVKTGNINKKLYELIQQIRNVDVLRKELKACLKEALPGLTGTETIQGMSIDEYADMQVKQLTSPWMLYFIRYDPVPVLENVRCPVLAINGSKDLQVNSDVNLKAIKEALVKGGNQDVTVKEMAGLNHLFQECETGLPSEYSTIEQTFSPELLKVITGWIQEQVKK
ncbi:MAG: alpha/beta hydrolase [Chlorobi bacterium]|nr:alpha/beta hydrolase [Chlorobiota bacterium]